MTTRREFIGGVAAAAAVRTVGAADRSWVDDFRFVDVHAHIVEETGCPLYGTRVPLSNPEEMIRFYDQLGVEKGCMLPLGTCENFIGGQSTDEILRVCAAHPDRFVPMLQLDPRMGGNHARVNFRPVMRYYRERGCKGIGEICANIRFTDPRTLNLLAQAEEMGMSVTFHVSGWEGYYYGLVDDPGLPGLEECLKRFPKLKFFGHSQMFWSEIGQYDTVDQRVGYPTGPVREIPLEGEGPRLEGRLAALMRTYPNLYGDLSAGSGANALMRDRAHAIRFMNEFQDRLMFGIDICSPTVAWVKLPQFLRELARAGDISETVFRKIGRGNVERLLGI